jgi:hypothetical protein
MNNLGRPSVIRCAPRHAQLLAVSSVHELAQGLNSSTVCGIPLLLPSI